MRYLLFLSIMLINLSGCVTTGSYHASGTTVGFSAGYQAASITLGYQKYEAVRCETDAIIDIGLSGVATITGIEGSQYVKFGGRGDSLAIPVSEDITVNEDKGEN